MAAEAAEYEAQLAAVDAALASDPGNEEWKKLRTDLLEVIALKQQLSAVRNAQTEGADNERAAARCASEREQIYFPAPPPCTALAGEEVVLTLSTPLFSLSQPALLRDWRALPSSV